MRIVIFILLSVYGHALFPQSFQQIVYGVEEGLPTHLVKCSAFDQYGFLWIGTDEGLIRYDGRDFEVFPNATPSRYVKQIKKLDDGSLYVASDLGITRIVAGIDSVSFIQVISGRRTMVDEHLWYPKNLFQDRHKNIWVAEPQSIVKLTQGKLKRYLFPPEDLSLSFFRSFSFFERNDDMFVLSYTGRLYCYDESKDKFILVQDLSDELSSVSALHVTKSGQILAGSFDGIFAITIDSLTVQLEQKTKAIREISVIEQYNDQLVVGNYANQFVFLNDDFDIINRFNIFQTFHISITGKGNLWVSSEEGLVLLKKNYFSNLEKSYQYIQDLDIAGRDIYYCYKSAVIRVNAEAGEYIQERILYDREEGYFLSISANEDAIWVSDRNFLHQLTRTGKVKQTIDLSERGMFIFNIHLDKKSRLWVTQDNASGILLIQPDGYRKTYDEEKGVISRILVLNSDENNQVYAGGSGDEDYLYRYDSMKDEFINLSQPVNLARHIDFEVNDLTARNDTVWLATTAGVMYYHKGKIEPLGVGRLGPVPVKAVMLNKKFLWFSHSLGVVRYDLVEGSYLLFNESAGLVSRSGNPRSLSVDEGGTVWVGTSQGVAFAEVGKQQLYKTEKPVITKVELDADKIPVEQLTGEIIPYNSFLNITFHALSFPG